MLFRSVPLSGGGDWSVISTTSIMGAPPSDRKHPTAIYDVWSLQLITTLAAAPRDLPAAVSHAPAYPNPAHGAAVKLEFTLPAAGRAPLRGYDVAGRAVRTLVDGKVAAGVRTTTWDLRASDGEAVCAGLYFYALDADGR